MAPKVTEEILKEFFGEQFSNTSGIFLYKDKQLLKEGDYAGFAREQLNRVKVLLWSIVFMIVICSWYGISSLIEYGSSFNTFDLVLGLGSWAALILFLIYASKEYYTIKSSMTLLQKLLEEDKNREEDVAV